MGYVSSQEGMILNTAMIEEKGRIFQQKMAGWRFLGQDFVFIGAPHGLWKTPFDNIDQKPVNAFSKAWPNIMKLLLIAEILHQLREW